MPQPMQVLSANGLGFRGLNTQQQSIEDMGWSQIANNAVIDSAGRLAARNGWAAVNGSAISGTPPVRALHEYKQAGGVSSLISAAGSGLYSGTSTLSNITGAVVASDAHWQFVNFNNNVIGFQANHTPIVYTGSSTFSAVSFDYPSSGTNTFGNVGLAAFGRLWSTNSNHTVLKYSDLLIHNSWTDDSGGNGDGGGSAGVIDLKSVWAYGMDSVTAIAEFNGFLVVFGKKTVLVYSGADDPSTMALADVVNGIGCVARDSVQNIGTDILFLSDSGVRSFRRTIQEKSMPITEISKNVRNEIASYIGTNQSSIKSVYHERDGFYIISFPVNGKSFVFDTRMVMEDGSYRVTTWTGINPTAFVSYSGGVLYLGQRGYVGRYAGYRDNGSTYRYDYYSMWTKFGQDRLKIPKKLAAVVYGGNGDIVTFRLGFDYSKAYKDFTHTIQSTGDASEYGVAEYGISEYSGSQSNAEINVNTRGSGNVLQLGISMTIDGLPFAVEKFELYLKMGRVD